MPILADIVLGLHCLSHKKDGLRIDWSSYTVLQ